MSYNDKYSALIAVDFGNSRVKLMVKSLGNKPSHCGLLRTTNYFSFSYSRDKDWMASVGEILLEQELTGALFCYSSVNSDRLDALLMYIGKPSNIEFVDAGELIAGQTTIDFSAVTGMGTDRKLGLFGALEGLKPPFITIDCGTATTVNVLDGRYLCLGGSIMPGLYTQAMSLADAAQGLEDVKLTAPVRAASVTTDEAIRTGIVTGSYGALKEIIARIAAENFEGAELPVIATGGAVGLLEPYLTNGFKDIRINKYLTLQGIGRLSC